MTAVALTRPTNIPLTSAIEEYTDLIVENQVAPDGYQATALSVAERISAVSKQRGLTTIDDACTHSAEVIGAVAGVKPSELTVYRGIEESSSVHIVRNTLAAIVACSTLTNLNWADTNQRTTTLAAVSLRGQKGRSLTDDEILLLRLLAIQDLKAGGRRSIPAIRYLLSDAGLYPSETTVVTANDFTYDHTHSQNALRPVSVSAPGVNQRALAREIPLDSFAAEQLRPIIESRLAQHQFGAVTPLAYTGTHEVGHHSASAAASTGLKKLMQRAGLDRNLQPLGIPQWRVDRTMQRHGIAAAREVSGKTSNAAVGALINKQIRVSTDKPLRTIGFLA